MELGILHQKIERVEKRIQQNDKDVNLRPFLLGVAGLLVKQIPSEASFSPNSSFFHANLLFKWMILNY